VEKRVYVIVSKKALIKECSKILGVRKKKVEEWLRREWSCMEVEGNDKLFKCLISRTVRNGDVEEKIVNTPLATVLKRMGYEVIIPD